MFWLIVRGSFRPCVARAKKKFVATYIFRHKTKKFDVVNFNFVAWAVRPALKEPLLIVLKFNRELSKSILSIKFTYFFPFLMKLQFFVFCTYNIQDLSQFCFLSSNF